MGTILASPAIGSTTKIHGGPDDVGAADERRNWMSDDQPDYRDHPCYGILGIDPRAHASAQAGKQATDRLIAHLGAWLDTNAPRTHGPD